jgi:thiol-disulfide isomerase/thioredoxin
MNPTPRLALAALLTLAGVCIAQDSAPKPAPAAPPETTPAEPNWPKPKEKNLYAAHDLRGKKAPDFAVQKFLTPEPDRKGKVVLIDFWATWCGPCREAIPEINALQKKFKDDLVCIGISDESPATVQQFAKKTKIEYPLAIDQTRQMHKAIGIAGIPHVLLISTYGIVRWQGFPLMSQDPLTEDIVKQIIDADPGVKARRDKAAGRDKPAAEKTSEKPAEKPETPESAGR